MLSPWIAFTLPSVVQSMKLSNYNLIVRGNSEKTIYANTITKAVVEIDAEILEKLVDEQFDAIPTERLATLRKLGFVVGDDMDELLFLQGMHYRSRFDQNSPSIPICPTLDCNFSCPYCFENPDYSGVVMSRSVVDGVISFFEKRARDWRWIGIRWFGGEPLLAIEVIERISKALISLADRYGIPYHSNMATNGYLLNRETLACLRSCRVSEFQITLDGLPAVHNRRRTIGAGHDTFGRILDNVCLALDMGFEVVLRVNIDRETYPTLPALLSMLESRITDKRRITIFTWPTTDSGSRSFDETTSATLYGFADYARNIEPEIIAEANQRGFLIFNRETKKRYRCPLYQVNSFYVDPLGYLYKCGFYVGILSRAFGRLTPQGDVTIINMKEHLEQVKYDAFNTDECRGCIVLPFCYGKCPVIWERQERIPGAGCIPEKYTVGDRFLNRIEIARRRSEDARDQAKSSEL